MCLEAGNSVSDNDDASFHFLDAGPLPPFAVTAFPADLRVQGRHGRVPTHVATSGRRGVWP